jgi:hypothetical protein
MALSYWDVWFVLVANAKFGSSWDRFVEHFRSQQGASSHFVERKLSHIRDLQRRLQQADVEIRDVVAQADPSPAEFVDLAVGELHDDQHAQAQAMLRAFLTVVIDLMEVADDSYGSLGDSFYGGFANYLAIPLEETGIEDTVFFHDLLSLLIWEDDGLTYDRMDGYFERLTSEAGDLCMDYLRQQIEELNADELDYQAEKALRWFGHIAAEQNRFERFEELAQEMGTRAWQRIIVLADRAVKKRKRKLAVAVFEAALGPGMHEKFLRKKCEQLKSGKWNPDPRK